MDDGPKANPFVTDRPKLETECLRLVREEAAETHADPVEVIARHSSWRDGAKLNPASMTDDRLLHTVRSLRKSAQERAAKAEEVMPGSPEWNAAVANAKRGRAQQSGGG